LEFTLQHAEPEGLEQVRDHTLKRELQPASGTHYVSEL
jgi:hypothetical protein